MSAGRVHAAVLLAIVAALAGGCRPDPGPSRYDEQEPFPDGGNDSLPGPMPYVPGERRLSIGAFYEGDASDFIPIDNMTAHLYVYLVDATMTPTASLVSDPDRIEGKSSTRVVHGGLTWWGLGVHWVTAGGMAVPRDLSSWTKLHVSLRSADPDFAMIDIGMNNVNPVFLPATSYGWANDDQWHTLTIPVADFVAAGLNLTQVAAPFVLTGGAGMSGEHLLVDDVYFTAD
jgi:hypothetical protein